VNDPVVDRYTVRTVNHVMWDHAPDELQRIEVDYTFNGTPHRGGGLPATVVISPGSATSLVFTTHGVWNGSASYSVENPDQDAPDVPIHAYRFRGPMFAEAFRHFGASVVKFSQMFYFVVEGGVTTTAYMTPTHSTHLYRIEAPYDIAWTTNYFQPYMNMFDTDEYFVR
jgi:hypothetical protein